MNKIIVKNDVQFQTCIHEGVTAGYEFRFVESTPWVSRQGGFETRDVVLERVSDGTFWTYVDIRKGNHYEGWVYIYSTLECFPLYQVKREAGEYRWRIV